MSELRDPLLRQRAVTYSIARLTVAFIWLYHGLIPKLIFHNPDEIAMLRPMGLPEARLLQLVLIAGWSEIVFALLLLVFWKSRWPLWVVIAGMVGLTFGVAIASPTYLTHAFDPLTLNLGVTALAVIALLTDPFDHS